MTIYWERKWVGKLSEKRVEGDLETCRHLRTKSDDVRFPPPILIRPVTPPKNGTVEENREEVSATSDFIWSPSSGEEDSLTDISSEVETTDDEEEEGDDDTTILCEDESPPVVIVAVFATSLHSYDESPPTATISVLQELFAGLDEDFDAENELLEKDETVVSALTGFLTK